MTALAFKSICNKGKSSPATCNWPECRDGAGTTKSARWRVTICGWPINEGRLRGPLVVCHGCKRKLAAMWDSFAGERVG